LKQIGVVYTETFTVQALLATVRQTRFDILFFDGNMIRNDGLVNHVRQISPNIPIVCLADETPFNGNFSIYRDNEIIINPPTSNQLF
jgi:voltage-gated potassium channel Kch